MLTRRSFLLGSAAAAAVVITATPFTHWDDLERELFSYQWYADGEPIAGATDKTYTITSDNVSKRLSLRVTATNRGNT